VSTILNALKRLDEQRRSDALPRTLEEQVLLGATARTASAGARDRLWRWIAGGSAVALLAAAGGWLALREVPAREDPARLAAAAPAAVQTQPALAPPPPAADPAPTAVETAARPASATAAADLAAPVPEPEPAAVATKVAPTREAPIRSVAQPQPVARAPREPSAPAREAAPTPPEPRAAAPAPDAHAARPAAALPETPPASLASEDAAASPERAPAVRVERTLWHPTPEKRGALVRVAANGEQRELREGDSVDGLVVQEIRPSGVIFLRDGREWRRGVGEE
jgi:outer membrane biosynthesis protein TonB